MKKSLFIFITLLLSTQSFARSGQKAIYGSRLDNEFTNKDSTDMIKILSTGIGYIVPKKRIRKYDRQTSMIEARPLRELSNLCSHERFAQNLASAPSCTGFLVAEDLLVTAGHCIEDKKDCKDMNIVFGVTVAKETSQGFRIANDNIYTCKKVITSSNSNGRDYSLIKLNKKVKARKIYRIGDDSKLTDKSSVYMIGHPLGLAVTYTKPARVTHLYLDDIFKAPLNSFSGNSGSPVLNAATDEVVGILTAGQTDYIKKDKECTRYARYNSGGETITRISLLKEQIEANK
ncbi:MAG TPA: serine protease [Bacteriovoracaceae bacterium]|nr:serine protease [Bacteriovoracaceae bacterium]